MSVMTTSTVPRRGGFHSIISGSSLAKLTFSVSSILAGGMADACDSGTSTLETYYSNFIARQLYAQKCLKYRKSQYWQAGFNYNAQAYANIYTRQKGFWATAYPIGPLVAYGTKIVILTIVTSLKL